MSPAQLGPCFGPSIAQGLSRQEYYLGSGKDPWGKGCGGRVACVAGDGFEVRSAENVLEVEGLGSGWLFGGDSFISRNPPWLRPWTVPGSTLWVFPRHLALKNPPVVPLGTLEKCGNSESPPMELGRIRVAKNNGYNEREFRFRYRKPFASSAKKNLSSLGCTCRVLNTVDRKYPFF
ncbi:hypothetical protein TNCT_149261 [Trichonephila clavata]|uniref:Uncharacterized protein n=1 Tax=Trichonephila clavata TaxID=2740835 RepID=A0A8X6HBE0_TRICU|nr:hypothetical protein TNCT_149261 [Trichonephila clavata]